MRSRIPPLVQGLSLGAAILLAAALSFLCLAPPDYTASCLHLPNGFFTPFLRFNKLYHVAGFFIFSLLVLAASDRKNPLSPWPALVATLILGSIIELLQRVAPCREGSLLDVGLDLLGSLMAIGVFWLLEKRQEQP